MMHNSSLVDQEVASSVVPSVLKKLGAHPSHGVTPAMVTAYLAKRMLHFDEELMEEMFREVDYLGKGYLDGRDLLVALTGRYPKRRFRLDFERLVGLVLGIEDFYVPRGLDEREAVLFTRKVTGTSRPTSPMRPAAAAAAASSSYLSGFSPQRRQRSQSSSASLARSSSPSPSSSLRRRERPASALSASASSLSGVLPAAQRGTAAEEARLNRLLVPAGGGGEGGGQQPLRLTLAAADKFYDARSLLSPRAVAGLSTSTQAAAAATVAPPGGATAAARRPSTAGPSPIINVATYRPVVAWAAPLPPRSVQFPVSPLTRLRQSLRSTAAAKPEFVGRSRPLTAHFTDLNRTLGG